MRSTPALLVALSLAALPAASQFLGSTGRIRPETIRAHMSFLADDLLEGRGTGTNGFEIAAKYVASQFASYGL